MVKFRPRHTSLPQAVSILGPLHFTELLVSEAAAAATCAPTGAAAAAAAPSGALDLDRIRNLGAAVEAIASFRDFFVRLTGHDYLAMSFELYAYLSFCMASLYGLSIIMLFGIVVGTYSSIYISSPVLVWLGVQPDSFLRSDEKDDSPEAQPA